VNDNDRRDLARVLLRAASQALECANPEDFSGLRQGTLNEGNRIMERVFDQNEAKSLSWLVLKLQSETSPFAFAKLASFAAASSLAQVRQ
jgi:hypothetical protein